MAITPGGAIGALFERWLQGALDAGADAIQIRAKGATDRVLLETAFEARSLLPESILLLINGRTDLALASRADGVHLPSEGVSITLCRSLLGLHAVIGRSTHRLGEIERARSEGASYVTYGPIFQTPGKPPDLKPVGSDGLSQAAAVGLPVVALGGLTTPEREAACREAGAEGIAGIRLFDTLPEPPG